MSNGGTEEPLLIITIALMFLSVVVFLKLYLTGCHRYVSFRRVKLMSDIMGSVMCPTKDSNGLRNYSFSYVCLIPLPGSLCLAGYQMKA